MILLINLSMLLQISLVRITSRDFPVSFSVSCSSHERKRERERDEPRAGELGKYKDAVITNKAVLDAVDAPFRTRIHLVFPFGFPILSEYL